VNWRQGLFLLAAALQIACGAVFVWDVVVDWQERSAHTWVEIAAVLALAICATITFGEYRRLLQRNQKVEKALDVASGAFHEVIDQHFLQWQLTDAERDVALMSIKGVPMADIARMRNTRDGTIKAQTAAIYRKAGVSSRAELLSVFVEELITGMAPTGR
jgi:DNA-binding NarL/FixJ family response regulator